MTRIGVIGAGRVGAVLAAALRESVHEIVAVAGESDASRIRIETLLPGVPVVKPSSVARAADVLLLTVPDDSLDNVVRMLSASGVIRRGQYVVHTSGRHGTTILDPAAERGAHVIAMHPAMTFTGTDIDLDHLSGVVYGVTAHPSLRPFVDQLVTDLHGEPAWIDEADRTLYHAALAHGANYIVTLVTQAMELLRATGAKDPAATLRPLLAAALENALSYGDAALTGPIVRGDIQTVRAHLAELAQTSSETLQTYVAMGRATANHAVADGRLDPARAAALIGVLNDAVLGSTA